MNIQAAALSLKVFSLASLWQQMIHNATFVSVEICLVDGLLALKLWAENILCAGIKKITA